MLCCKIFPNDQLSTLGDGLTKLGSIGEIDVTFFRNDWKVRFRAVVVKHLQSSILGGTVFLKDNKMEQNLFKLVIHIHDRRITVPETDPITLLPIQAVKHDPSPSLSLLCPVDQHSEPPQNWNSTMVKCKSTKVILPGQNLYQHVDIPEDTVVDVEPWEQNKNADWPEPQLCLVKNSSIEILNNSNEPIILGKDVLLFKVRPTVEHEDPSETDSFYKWEIPSLGKMTTQKHPETHEIKFGEEISTEAKELITNAHDVYDEVFNKDLSEGYNDFYGRHRCKLNWAGAERPFASKVRVPNYNHDLKGLQQDLMDELTIQGVLLIPQEHNINIQSVCPSFLQRKQRAKDKSQHLLTKDDVRLLINFGPVNDKIKPDVSDHIFLW